MAEVPWLSEPEQRAWRAYLEATSRLADRFNRDLQRTHGLSMADYEILVRLSEAPERMIRMTQLAGETHSSKSRLSHAINRLESAGMVERIGCNTDKRGWFAKLTGRGFELLEHAAPDHVRSVRRHFLDAMSEQEFLALGRTMSAVAAHLRSEDTSSGALSTPPAVACG
jgi:DNA-binding MarR family transcriptional regulator